MSNAPHQPAAATALWGVTDLHAVNTFSGLTESAARELAQAEANKTGFQHIAVDTTTGAYTRFEPMAVAS